MKVFRSLESFEKGPRATATIGTFDGVHLGHQKILDRLMEAANEVKGESIVISFDPHPRLVLFPEDNPLRLLQDVDEKIAALETLGIDKLLLIPFTREFSRLTSHQFISEVLVQTVAIHRIVIGYDHHFGKNRTGGLRDLQEGAAEFGFQVEEIPAEQIDNANVSSTKIRQALAAWDLATARRFLGYDYSVRGTVIRGEQLGRKLGYPTANVRPKDPLKLIPAEGVYLASLLLDGEEHFGMLNVGKKPTIGDDFPLGIEIHLFNFDRDIYDRDVQVRFLEWIRPDKKFASLEELKSAIAQDQLDSLALIAERNA